MADFKKQGINESTSQSLSSADVPRLSTLENCRDFTIQGGTFNVSTTVEQPQGNFRVVKLGDLNLLDKISEYNVVERHPVHRKKTGVVVRHVEVVVGTRKIYRARIFGSQDPMTAVVHNDAQFEQARHHLHRMAEVREGPQFRFRFLIGTEMMPISEVEKLHAKSALASHYFQNEITQNFFISTELMIIKAAQSYWENSMKSTLLVPRGSDCPLENCAWTLAMDPDTTEKLPPMWDGRRALDYRRSN
ncbi:hypothetical protein B0H13DRAFT_1907719 [Mycena leptocephala]|nr:hypothetical protein B0H13DRAFT_1907719 [Mycena leptocephala]